MRHLRIIPFLPLVALATSSVVAGCSGSGDDAAAARPRIASPREQSDFSLHVRLKQGDVVSDISLPPLAAVQEKGASSRFKSQGIYDRLRQQKLVISSGLIEGTVRHLVGMRLDGPGMRWGKSRAEAVLNLRCVLLNGLWTEFESYLAARNTLRLASKPVPTATHDAKTQVGKAA